MPVLYEKEGKIVTITLNLTDTLNRIDGESFRALSRSLMDFRDDPEAWVAVITGTGETFSTGADHGTLLQPWADKSFQVPPLITRGLDIWKPLIAAINGPAVGVGITMTLPMDIRIASTKAKIGFAFNRRGMIPEGCSTWFLPRIVGISRASEWMTTGRILSSQEALEGGLVSQVVEPDKLIPTAYDLAKEIRDNTSAISTILTRQMLWRMLGADHPMEAHKIESRNLHYMFQSADLQEGVASFLEKRSPNFPMKPSRDLPDFYPWWKDRPYSEE